MWIYKLQKYNSFFPTGEVIVIPGGFTDTSTAEVEVYSPLGGCQHKVTYKIKRLAADLSSWSIIRFSFDLLLFFKKQ